MFNIIFLMLKGWLSVFIKFASTTVGMICIGVAIVIGSVLYSHHIGVKSGIAQQVAVDKKAYDIELAKRLTEQKEKQDKANAEAIKFVESQKKVEIVYKDRVKTLTKIVHDNPVTTSLACTLPKPDLENFNKLLDDVK